MPPWAVALVVTLIVEVPVVAALYPRQRRKMASVAVVANIATNLTLNLLLPHLEVLRGRHLLPGEIMAVVVEAAAYAIASRPRDVPRALVASSLANALSFGLGLIPWLQPFLRS
jgi:hypothetical protein